MFDVHSFRFSPSSFTSFSLLAAASLSLALAVIASLAASCAIDSDSLKCANCGGVSGVDEWW